MTELAKNVSAFFVGGPKEEQDPPDTVGKGDFKRQQRTDAQAALDAAAAQTTAKGDDDDDDKLKKPPAATEQKQKTKWTASTAIYALDQTTRAQKKKPNVVLLLRFLRDLAGCEGYRDVSMVWQRCKEYDELEADFAANWHYHVTPVAAAEIKQALAAVQIKESLFALVLADTEAATHLCGLIACRYVNFRAGKQAHAGTRAATAYAIQDERRHLQWLLAYSGR